MVSLWRTRNSDSSSQQQQNEEDYREDSAPPNEHTRLLPNRVDSSSGLYLSPDNQQVTPYREWYVKWMRAVTVIFTVLTFAWWVVLFVSIFVTPPALHSPGSNFFGLSYTSVTFINLIFTLIFFTIPAKPVRILGLVMAVVLTIDMIITLSVGRLRHEEDVVGIVSLAWALVMALWAVAADKVVKHGKAAVEADLTGRPETRRSCTEFLGVTTSTIGIFVLLIAVILMFFTMIMRALDAGVAPPGKRYSVDSGRYKMHVHCQGNITDSSGHKLPTVLLEGGEDTVENGLWQLAEDAVRDGSISRYCFVDRPGYAWSDSAPSPMSASMAVTAMSEALARAGEHGPWVIASAGIGTIYSRVFSSQHGDEISGLFFIDPLHEKYLKDVAAPFHRFLLWVRGILSPLGLDRLPGAIFKGRTKADRIWGKSAHQDGKYIFTRLQESLVADSFTKRDVESSRAIQHKDTPLVIVTSGEQLKNDRGWEKAQRDLSKLTENLKHWDIVDHAPHRVWDTPEGREKITKRLKQLVHLKN